LLVPASLVPWLQSDRIKVDNWISHDLHALAYKPRYFTGVLLYLIIWYNQSANRPPWADMALRCLIIQR
jgi:hypothetical protein